MKQEEINIGDLLYCLHNKEIGWIVDRRFNDNYGITWSDGYYQVAGISLIKTYKMGYERLLTEERK